MDIKKALELIDSGRYSDIDLEDLWEIIQVLSSSSDSRAVQALMTLQASPVGQNIPQASLAMHNIIETNARIVAKLEQEFNLFELDKSGRPVQAEVVPVLNFFSRVQINNKPETEPVKSENLFSQAVDVAKTTAKKDLYLDKNFSKLKPEEQKKTYINTVLMSMEENAFVLVSNQILENISAKKKGPMTNVEKDKLTNIAEKRFANIINPESKVSFKLSNTNIIGTAIAEINRAGNSAALIQENTGSLRLTEKVRELDKHLSPLYPETFQTLRPLSKAPNLSFMAGSVGKTTFSANTIAAAVHDNNPAKKQKEVSMFTFLKQQPLKLKGFSKSIMTSLKKVYNNLHEAMNVGLINSKLAGGFKKMLSHLSSHTPGTKFNGVGPQTLKGNLQIMSAKVSQIVNQPDADKRVVAWKDFRNTFYSSQMGRALNQEFTGINPERTTLVADRQEDYTKVTNIVLNRRQESLEKKPGVVQRIVKTPLNVVGRVVKSFKSASR